MSTTGVFSYAQAAKGLGSSSAASSIPPSSASSDHGSKDRSSLIDSVTTQQKQTRKIQRADTDKSTAKSTDIQSSGEATHDRTRQEENDTSLVQVNQQHDGTAEENRRTSSSTANPVDRQTIEVSAGDQAAVKGLPSASEDREKSREVDDDWEKVSIPSNPAEKELKAAPIPQVNIWQKRREEQQAKLKESTAQQPASVSSQPKPKVTTSIEEVKKKTPSRDAASESSAARQTAPISRTTKEQKGVATSPRNASHQSNNTSQSPPPPVDTASWPTPEIAAVDTTRRSSIADKTDRSEQSENKSSSRKNQWQAMPFVPTVKFETQLPGSARRGGRPANERGRGGRASQSDRTAQKGELGAMGPPPAPKSASEHERGRKNNNAKSTRPNSSPQNGPKTGKNNSSPGPTPLTAQATTFEPRLADLPVALTQEQVPASTTPSTISPSRSSSRNAIRANNFGDVADIPSFTPSMSAPEAINTSIQQTPRQDSRQSGLESHRSSQDFSSERSAAQLRDHKKERVGSTRDQEHWRETRGQSGRGRGNFRGRGNHSNYTPTSPFTSPLPQTPFDTSRAGSLSEMRGPRQPQAFSSTSHYAGSRGVTRSQSIPAHVLQGTGFFQPPMPNFGQAFPPVQNDLNYGGFSSTSNGIPSSIMPGMPYQEQLNGFATISMVSGQLEYYFSVDNLCKDMFLRKNMDSQGFVPLRVVYDFRRVKALLGDGPMAYDQLRSVVHQVRNVELAQSEDGQDFLRPRGNWESFVLPMEERLPTARNEGPKIPTSAGGLSITMPYDSSTSNGGLRSAPPQVNGFHDSFMSIHQPQSDAVNHDASYARRTSRHEQIATEEARRSSTTSPLQKAAHSPDQASARLILDNMANGHRESMSSNSEKENTFPDENVSALKVVVKDPEYQNGEDLAASEESSISRTSGLRGGASSPPQLDKFRNLTFGDNVSPLSRKDDSATYFTTNDGPPPQYLRPGYIHEDYLTLRERAQAQRAEGYFDGAVLALYPLWAEFLTVPNQFNVGMYEDFRNWAMEDHDNGNANGKKHLVRFYDAMLGSKTPITGRIARDVTNIARAEDSNDRLVWQKMRTAWRNGATHMKTVKRLNDLLTPEEKKELEKGTT